MYSQATYLIVVGLRRPLKPAKVQPFSVPLGLPISGNTLGKFVNYHSFASDPVQSKVNCVLIK